MNPEYRWVLMAELVSWDEMAKLFYDRMCQVNGRRSVDLQVVLGTLLVKHLMNLSDEDTIEYIQENI
ncbi:MAG: hypothetical protein MK226_18680 [Saprospiraceae bacterium]|nr:hypothetical protein [Saprospiraceae bacterium]